MMIDKQNPFVEKSDNPRMIRLILLAVLVLGTISALLFAFLGKLTDAWQLYAIAIGSAVPVMTALVGLLLVRQGKTLLAAWLILMVMLSALTLGPFLYQGLGALLGLGAVFLGTFVAGEILPRRHIERVIIISIGIGTLDILVDLFGPSTRPQASNLIVIILSVLLAAATVVIGYNFIRNFKNYSLRVKLIVGMVAVAVLSTAAISVAINTTIRGQIEDQVYGNVNNQARSTAQIFGNYVENQIELLKTLANNSVLINAVEQANATYEGDPATIQTKITQLNQQWHSAILANNNFDPLIQSSLSSPASTDLKIFHIIYSDHGQMLVTDRYGSVTAATKRISDYNHADKPWWQAASNNGRGAIFISTPERDLDTNAYILTIAVPILNQSGNFIGVLASNYQISGITQRIASARVGELSNASLLFPDGKLLDASGNISTLDAETQAKVTQSAAHQGQFLFQGKQRIVSEAALVSNSTEKNFIHSLGWAVVIDEDPIKIMLPLQATTRTSLFVGLITLLAVSFLAAMGAQFLFSPLIHLTHTAEQVHAGDLNVRANIESQDEIGILAKTFNSTTEQLQFMLQGLEQRVSERTVELEQRSRDLADRTVALELANVRTQKRAAQFQAISDVSRATASVRKLNELLPRIAVVVSEQFGFYHTGIFLLDEAGEYAILSAANSDGGQRMLARGHRLKVGSQGIVGYVTDTGQPRIALDTGKDAVFFDNPDLPDTRSELAIPLKSAGKIIGALDVQSNQSNAFSQEDSDVLQVLADQISAAIENTRQFEQTQRSLSEVETIYRQYLRREWDAISQRDSVMGYRHTVVGTQPIERPLENSNVEEALSSGIIQTAVDTEANESTLAVPIKLRDEVIGVLNVRAPRKRAWSTDEINMVKSVADRVAISAENARLFEETTNRAERERTVSNITSKIRSTNDPSEMIQTALDELKQALNIKVARIVPYAPPSSKKES